MTTDVPAPRTARALAAGACAFLLVAGCSSDAPGGEVDADATVEGVPTPPPETDALAPPTEES